MVFNTSYQNKKIEKQIDQTVGNAFSFKERWSLGGIGSKRMKIRRVNEHYRKYLNADYYVSNANIEIRPKGLIIHFKHKLHAYSWTLPFDALVIKNESFLRLEAGDEFVEFLETAEETFLQKVNSVKSRLEKGHA